MTAEICWRLQISAMIAWHVLKLWLMAWLQGSKLDKDQRMVAMTRFPSCYFENKRDSSGPFPSQNLINNLGKHAIHLRSNLTSHPTLVTHWAYVSRGWYVEEDPLLFVAIKIYIHSNLSRLEYFKSLCQDLWYNSMKYEMQKHHTIPEFCYTFKIRVYELGCSPTRPVRSHACGHWPLAAQARMTPHRARRSGVADWDDSKCLSKISATGNHTKVVLPKARKG